MIGIAIIIILAILIIVAFSFLRVEHQTRLIKIVLIILVLVLIYFSLANLFNSNDIDLKSPRGIVGAVYLYFGWIGESVAKLWDFGANTVDMVGNAIRMDNSTNKETHDGRR